jgi:hypothetical protein
MSRDDSAKKPPKGRPVVDSEPVNVRIERQQLAALDDWRRGQSDLPSRPEAIRRLIELGLKVPPVPASVEGLAEYYKHIGRPDLAEAVLGVMKDIKP